MNRALTGLAAIVLFVSPVLGQDDNKATVSLKMMVLVADADHDLVANEVITRSRYVPRTRTQTVNGVTRNITENVPVMETVTQKTFWRPKDVSVFDLAGAKIDPDRLPEMFKKPRAVVVSSTGKIDPAVREVLKDNALIVVLPPAASKPAGR